MVRKKEWGSGSYGFQYEVKEDGEWIKHIEWFKSTDTRNNAMKAFKLPPGARKFRRYNR